MPRDDDVKAIDAVCNLRTPEIEAKREHEYRLYTEHFGKESPVFTVEELLNLMDENNIESAFLIAQKTGSKYFGLEDTHVPYETVHGIVKNNPERFYGLAGIDPWEGMEGVRALKRAVEDMDFIGAHLYPHWFYMKPDHRKFYPFYAKCAELDIPIQIQVGHCLVYLKDHPPHRSVGRPILLDNIACDFPDLKLVGIHTGYPWVDEMISVAYKHPNVYICTDAHDPRYWKSELVEFINSWGKEKVIFGTDFPVVGMEQAISGVNELGLREESRRKLLRENTKKLYDI